MDITAVDYLRCPVSGSTLTLEDVELGENGGILRGKLVSENGKNTYLIKNHIPRFVPESNYADNFGRQWNYFRKTQLDSYSGHPISGNRFWAATDWDKEKLKDKWVLDVGCGAGRFAEIALEAGANVVALDYSNAIDACNRNLNHFPNFYPIQGDIYNLPFKDELFDYIYSLGVLQHTPKVEKAFSVLLRVLKKGGKICVDTYWKRIQTILHVKYLIRPITKRMDSHKLFSMIEENANTLIKINREVLRVPYLGKYLTRFIPIADYKGKLPLNDTQLIEWAILDTYDMLAPKYDKPQSLKTLKKWFDKYGLINANVRMEDGFNGPTGYGEKPK